MKLILPIVVLSAFFSLFARGQGGAGLQGAPMIENCQASATCASPIPQQLKIVTGTVAFSSATTAGVSGLPAFTATADYACVAMDPTNVYTWTIKNTGTGAFTITSGTSNSDTWTYVCTGY